MLFGRVHGTAVCTVKYPGTEGVKLLVVQPLNKNLEPVGTLQVAADVIQAGVGDVCVMVRSREASLAMVGIVDELSVRPHDEFDYELHSGVTRFT
jgi:ethanolamine utilization protein EutN